MVVRTPAFVHVAGTARGEPECAHNSTANGPLLNRLVKPAAFSFPAGTRKQQPRWLDSRSPCAC